MKRNTRSLLITSLILFCAGLLLALSAALYGMITHEKIFEVKKKDRNIESLTLSINEILASSPDSFYVKDQAESFFTSVDISSFAGDIRVCTGTEKTEVVLDRANTENLKVEISGSTLKIEEEDPVGFLGFYIGEDGISFKGLRHIFSPGNAINSGKTITLYLANDTAFEKLNIDSFAGDILIQAVNFENINVLSDYGNVDLLKLKNPNAKIVVKGSAGDVNLKENAYLSCSVSKKIGNIEVDLISKESQSTILDVWCGNVDVESALPVSSYKLNLSTSLGTTEKNGKSFGKKHKANGDTASRISSTVFLGDIAVLEKKD